MSAENPKPEWAEAVIRVGDGRGFVVGTDRERFVITAGHCLPELPPFDGASSYTEERTFDALLGPIGEEPKVSAECKFADPIADLAILGSPDSQHLAEQARAYEAMVEGRAALTIDAVPRLPNRFPDWQGRGWLLSLAGDWFDCELQVIGNRCLWIENAAQAIVDGMSGSPIIIDDGRAIGIVCISSSIDEHRSGGPNPYLAGALPAWAFSELVLEPAVRKEMHRTR